MYLEAKEIQAILPHRYPMLLVDRIVDGEPGVWALGRKCVTINEAFFQGHFPQEPVMPGVLLLESMAQVGAVALLSMAENKGKLALFAGVEKARFKKQVIPGDVLEIKTTLTRIRGRIGYGEGEIRVDGKVAVSATLIFAIQ